MRQLLSHEPRCVIVAEGQDIPEQLRAACEGSATPLLASPLPSNKLADDLHYYLSNLLAEAETLHGVYMEVMSIGVLLTGESGVGKSELAMELITRGHRLIADDAPEFSRIAPDIVNGTCPKALQDFLEVRGLGILNIRELFGAGALRSNKYLRLIIRLERLIVRASWTSSGSGGLIGRAGCWGWISPTSCCRWRLGAIWRCSSNAPRATISCA